MQIRTPDQRLRVFVSSTLGELSEERQEVRMAIERLHLYPVMFELGARPHPPRALYRAYLQQSQLFVGIYWQSYGWVAPDMDVSGIEDEFNLSEGMPRLIYIKGPAPERQPRLKTLLDRIRDASDSSYKHFTTSDELRELVANDIAVLLTERFEASLPQWAPASDEPTELPSIPTRLVGREKEVADIEALLLRPEVRLVTLTGAGGIGKTRCGIEAATRFAAHAAHQVAYVPLESLQAPEDVLRVIATASGARVEGALPLLETLADYFRERDQLLLLDNFEGVIQAGPDLAQLMTKCPRLKLLVTSRVVLRLRGEREYQIPPLTLPGQDSVSVESIAVSPAVQLFVDRAIEIRPDFVLDRQNAEAVAEICRRLDGLPLAIELAAARIRLLSPEDLLKRLGACLDELTSGAADLPERQRALRATMEWSYSLLSPRECELFEDLAVFAGGWTLEAAENVCGDANAQMLNDLSLLVEKSLLRIDYVSGYPRFGMLETVRTYAREKLEASGRLEALLDRHAVYFRDYAEVAREHIESADQSGWLNRLLHDNDNLRQMVSRFLSARDIESLARVANALRTYWWLQDQMPANQNWMEDVLPDIGSLDSTLQAQFLLCLGLTVFEGGDFEFASRLLTRAKALFEGTESASGLAWTLALLGPLEVAFGRGPDSAVSYLEEADAIARRSGDRWVFFYVLTIHANVRALAGQSRAGMNLMQEALDIAREFGNPLLIAHASTELGILALLENEMTLARERLAEGAELLRSLHHREGLSYLLDGMGIEAVIEGDLEKAATAFGAAEGVREAIKLEMWPPIRGIRRPYIERLERELAAQALTARMAEGRAMTTEEATRFVTGGLPARTAET